MRRVEIGEEHGAPRAERRDAAGELRELGREPPELALDVAPDLIGVAVSRSREDQADDVAEADLVAAGADDQHVEGLAAEATEHARFAEERPELVHLRRQEPAAIVGHLRDAVVHAVAIQDLVDRLATLVLAENAMLDLAARAGVADEGHGGMLQLDRET